ncbi:MAG: serine/threonine-protein kinase [Acidobacteriota bacterium]
MAIEADLTGSTISHYEVIERLGAGGMGVVYKARDTRLNRLVALKFLPPQLTGDPAARQRFVEEARTASAFDHPHVCTVHDIDETADGQVFMAMAYVPGETLKARLCRGALPVLEALNIAIQVAEGLLEAHEHGVAHRDIKPGNVLIDHDGRVKIVDFGLATLVGLPQEPERGMIMGTLAYMSPEQTRNEPVDHRSDIWSLGVTIVEMLTGRPPFGDRESQPLLHRVQTDRPEPLERQRPDAPAELSRIVSRCLEKERHRRYRTAVELRADLLACRDLVAGQTAGAPPPAPQRRGLLARFLRRG